MKFHTLLITVLLTAAAQAVEVSEKGNLISIENKSLRLAYDMKSGNYSGTDLNSSITVFSEARFTVDESGWRENDAPTRKWTSSKIDDKFGKGQKLSITEKPNAGYRLTKTFHISVYDNLPYAVLGFSVTNHQPLLARIGRIGVIDNAKFLPGKKLTNPQVLRGGAGAEKNRVENQLEIDAVFLVADSTCTCSRTFT